VSVSVSGSSYNDPNDWNESGSFSEGLKRRNGGVVVPVSLGLRQVYPSPSQQ
jgi:hypothetical protein